jgi:type IV pilus assembly protein PilP
MMKHLKFSAPLVCLLVLSSCSSEQEHKDLHEFMMETKKRPSGEIPDLPPFVPYQPFAYAASTLRSPFEKPIPVDESAIKGGRTVVPDLTRAPEFLEGFNITSLKMVGSVTLRGVVWALIDTSDGNVVRATAGNYMGRNYGKIISVTQSQIEVMEIVSNGVGGWVENPRIIKLEEKE